MCKVCACVCVVGQVVTDLPRDRDLRSRRLMLLPDGREHGVGDYGSSLHLSASAKGTEHGHHDTMTLGEPYQVYIDRGCMRSRQKQ